MPTFLVCTTHWCLTNNFLLPKLTAHALLILLLVPKSLLRGIPITATAQDLHHPQYLQPHKTPHRPNDGPHPKNPAYYHITAILVPRDELVMKSYMHVWMAIVETHYHNLNINIKNQDYWLLT